MLDNYKKITLKEINANAIIYLSKKHGKYFTFLLDALIYYYNENVSQAYYVDNSGYIKVSYDYLSYYSGLTIQDVYRFFRIIDDDGFIFSFADEQGITYYKPNITAIKKNIIKSGLEFDRWFGYMMAVYNLSEDGSSKIDQTKIKKGDNGIHSDAALDEVFTQKDFKGAYTNRYTKKVYKEEYIEKIKKYYPYIDIIRTRVFWELDKDQSKEYEGELVGWLSSETYNKSPYELEDEKDISYIHYMLLCNEKGGENCFNENVYGDNNTFNSLDAMLAEI